MDYLSECFYCEEISDLMDIKKYIYLKKKKKPHKGRSLNTDIDGET